MQLLLWNGSLDQAKSGGDGLLGRTIRIAFAGLDADRYAVAIARVDEEHSNLAGRLEGLEGWPTPEQWDELRRDDRLDEEQLPARDAPDGRLELELRLPMPGVARVRLEPA